MAVFLLGLLKQCTSTCFVILPVEKLCRHGTQCLIGIVLLSENIYRVPSQITTCERRTCFLSSFATVCLVICTLQWASFRVIRETLPGCFHELSFTQEEKKAKCGCKRTSGETQGKHSNSNYI